jgi:hypothetical protein
LLAFRIRVRIAVIIAVRGEVMKGKVPKGLGVLGKEDKGNKKGVRVRG